MEQQLLKQTGQFETSYTVFRSFEFPNICLHCKRLTAFDYKDHNFNKRTNTFEVLIRCKYGNCEGFVIAYQKTSSSGSANIGLLSHTEPPLLVGIELPEFANEISPNFVSIFNEAVEAKSRGLGQIAGAGSRKACEFLIKDYAKSLITETDEAKKTVKEQEIEKKFVGEVVNKYITDLRVQKVAKRAFWIGNDETHYIKKWTDKDVDDLVTLIKLTLDWIEIERLSAKYEDEMPES